VATTVQSLRNVELERGARMVVRLTDQFGADLPGVIRVTTFHPGNLVLDAVRAPRGVAVLNDLASGPTILVAQSEGFAPAAVSLQAQAGQDHGDVPLSLRRAARIRGAIVDRSGTRYPGATIIANYDAATELDKVLENFLRRHVGGQEGADFEVRNVVPGAPLRIIAERAGKRSEPAIVVLVAGEERSGLVLVID
jgi:hypothetical protein